MRATSAFCCSFLFAWAGLALGQVTTTGFDNSERTEAPGTLLSHPVSNGSEPIGRTTSINYLSGWIIIGAESPGSRAGSDLLMRVYDISDPEHPARRLPSEFLLSYADNAWHQGNVGWNAHGTAQAGTLLLPSILRVSSFGGLVELGGTGDVPGIERVPIGYNRSSQAGPWDASFPWYGTPDGPFQIQQVYPDENGYSQFQPLATFDHVGEFGGGDWHPLFFGDLLIYARSGSAARDGVVVYRLQYHNFEDPNPASRSVTPQFVGSLPGGFEGYWPVLYSDGSRLYVIGSSTDVVMAADVTEATHPGGSGSVTLARILTVPGLSNAPYPVFQDHHGFIHNRKIDMNRLVSGDPNPIVLTLDEAGYRVNTSQMSLALGNLWLTGGYPQGFNPESPLGANDPGYQAQGMGVWVHQQAPDTNPPRVSFHIPQSGRTSYPRHAPLSFLIFEHPRQGSARNGIDFTVRPVAEDDSLGPPAPGFLIHDFSGVMTFTPEGGLAPDTTYQVDFLANPATGTGFRDAAGNYIEPYSFRFATGGGLNASPPPVWASLTASSYQPEPGQPVTITGAATGTGALQYRFLFEGTWSAWSASATAEHTYAHPGRPRVLAQVRDAEGNAVTHSLSLLVTTPLSPGPRPTQSSTLAVGDDAGVRRLWSVNPDADTVTVIRAGDGAKEAELAVGENPRGIARDANGRYWVTCHRSDEIRVLNADGSAHATVALPYGSAPHGIAPSPDGLWLYVTLQGSARLHRYSAADPNAPPLVRDTFPTPRAIAISGDGGRVLVTRFLSSELEGEIGEFDASLQPVRTFTLASSNSIDGGDRAAGVPNYLAGIAISPDGTRAAVVSKQDNVQRGLAYGVANLTHETAVRAVISFLDLEQQMEIRNSRRDFDNSDSPSAVTYTPLGDMLLVTLQGNNTLVGLDALALAPAAAPEVNGGTVTTPAVIALEAGTGQAPQGVLLDSASLRIFTQDFMGRSISVFDAQPLLEENRTTLPPQPTVMAVTNELLAPQVLLGKRIFYQAADPRMSADGYLSCATCHVDGGHDGRVWDFTGRGEGLRRTTDLRGRSGMGHGNVHWSGNFDEIQDFEHDIRGPFGGTGFLNLTPSQFAARHPSPATGKTGLSADLDALAAYVASLTPEHTPRSPLREPGGSFTAAALRGQGIFAAQGCAACHSGAAFSNSAVSPVGDTPLSNTGTLSSLSGSRLGQPLTGIDTPTLHGVHAARVFLHHGQASTLEEVFSAAGGSLHLAASAELLSLPPSAILTDNPAQGGGGLERGLLGGTLVDISGSAGAGVRFSNLDGGLNGGPARLQVRHILRGAGSALVRVNGEEQSLPLLPQLPDNAWMTSGWRWSSVDITLLPGASNTIEILRSAETYANFQLNAILLSTGDHLAAAQPHHVAEGLGSNDRADLLAYLLQLDGRDAGGLPLPAPPPPAPQAPSIVNGPAPVTLAAGNNLSLTVAVAGTGPFTYQWYRDATPVGSNSPELNLSSVHAGDGGAYSVTVSNSLGSVSTGPISVTINPALSVVTNSLPAATVGQAYSAQLAASGGVSSRAWSLQSGILPPGLSLSPEGLLGGTPTATARADVTVRVTDGSGSATRSLALDALPAQGLVPDPDLILHYTFDEGNGTRVWDSAPAGDNHATTVPAAHWIADGRFGGAYGPSNPASPFHAFFPAHQADLNFDPRGDAFTVSVWVRSTAGDGYYTVLGKDADPSNWQVQYRLWANGSQNQAQAVNGNVYGPAAAVTLNDGQWHLLTLTNQLSGATWRTRLSWDDGTAFSEFDTGPGGSLPQELRIGDTSPGGNPWMGQMDDLRIYRRALSPHEISALFSGSPAATLALAPGQETNSARPFAEFDVFFSEPVEGLEPGDFIHGGTGGQLAMLEPGLRYRLRIAGFAGAGPVTVHLPAGSAAASGDGAGNAASNQAAFTYTPLSSDDLESLSDEFSDPSTLLNWERLEFAEGWNASKLQTWDIDTSRSGHMRLVPYASTWYADYRGAFAFKTVPNDFVATLRLQASRRDGLAGRPAAPYSLAGLLLRVPRPFTNAAPAPHAGPETVLPWPPAGYSTPWTPGDENYLTIAYGHADSSWGAAANTWHCLVGNTIDSASNVDATQQGIPADTDLVTLQMVRRGSTFLLLRRHGEAGPWLIQDRIVRAGLPETLQLGISAYSDWAAAQPLDPFHHNRIADPGGNPDLVADASYFRLRRPAPGLTENLLQTLNTTRESGAQVTLSSTAAANLLGDAADAPSQPLTETFDHWLAAHLTAGQLLQPDLTSPGADPDGNGIPSVMEFALGSDAPAPVSVQIQDGTVLLTLTRNSAARGVTLIVESSTDLLSWTTLATSVDGAAPSGSVPVTEGSGAVRSVTLEIPANPVQTFFRARVVESP